MRSSPLCQVNLFVASSVVLVHWKRNAETWKRFYMKTNYSLDFVILARSIFLALEYGVPG